MKFNLVSFLAFVFIGGVMPSNTAFCTLNYDEIEDVSSRIKISNAVESLSFEEDTLKVLEANKPFVEKSFTGYEENAAYMFAELGNYYLNKNNIKDASHSYKMALSYFPHYEALLSSLHRVGVSNISDISELEIENSLKSWIVNK